MNKKCDECKFWCPPHVPEDDREQFAGECHKNPPYSQHHYKYPPTYSDDWCGEHQPKDTTHDK